MHAPSKRSRSASRGPSTRRSGAQPRDELAQRAGRAARRDVDGGARRRGRARRGRARPPRAHRGVVGRAESPLEEVGNHVEHAELRPGVGREARRAVEVGVRAVGRVEEARDPAGRAAQDVDAHPRAERPHGRRARRDERRARRRPERRRRPPPRGPARGRGRPRGARGARGPRRQRAGEGHPARPLEAVGLGEEAGEGLAGRRLGAARRVVGVEEREAQVDPPRPAPTPPGSARAQASEKRVRNTTSNVRAVIRQPFCGRASRPPERRGR